MLLLLFACAPPDDVLLSPEAAPISEARALALLDGPEWGTDERARITSPPEATLVPGGPPLRDASGGLWFDRELPVVEADDDGLVVLSDNGAARLLVRIPDAALDRVLFDDTWVDADGGSVAAGAPGVLLRAGVAPRAASGRLLVDLDFPLTGALPVPTGAVDTRWLLSPPPPPTDFGDLGLDPGVRLRDDHGRPLATVTDPHGLGARRVRTEGDRVLVDIRGPHGANWAALRAWVDTTEARFSSWGSAWGASSCRCGGWLGIAGDDSVIVPADTLVYDAPGGTPVGLLQRPLPSDAPDAEAGFATELWTDFGRAPVWIPPATEWGQAGAIDEPA